MGADAKPAPGASIDAKAEAVLGWRVGEQHEFELSLSTAVRLGRVTDFDMTITGTIAVTVLSSDGPATALHLRVGRMTVSNRAERHQQELETAITSLAQTECFFDLNAGRLSELRLPPLSPIGVNTLRQIASMFQLAPGNTAREAEEFDTTGKYLAGYGASAPDGVLIKRKIRYLGLLDQGTDTPVQVVPKVVEGLGSVRVSPSGLLEESTWREEVLIEGAQVAVRSVQSHKLRRLGSKSHVATETLLAVRDGMQVLGADQAWGRTANPGALDNERIKGLPFRNVISELEDLARRASAGKPKERPAKGKGQEMETERKGKLFSALAAHLRLDTRNVKAVEDLIKRHSPASPDLVAALGSAGTAETHAALGRLLEEGGLGELNEHALQSVARTQHPDAKAIAIMHAVLAKHPYDERAMYALGSYSRLFRNNGQIQTAATLGEELVGKLADAKGPGTRLISLRAIANSGYAGALGKVEPLLASPDEDTRATALRALQSMRDPRIDGLIATGMTADKSIVVRLSAIEAANLRAASDALVSAVVRASVDAEPRVRYRAIELLGKWLPGRTDLRSPLETAAKKDLEPRIRELASEALSNERVASTPGSLL